MKKKKDTFLETRNSVETMLPSTSFQNEFRDTIGHRTWNSKLETQKKIRLRLSLKETTIFAFGASKPHAYIEQRFAGNVGVRFSCRLVRKKSYLFGLRLTWLFFWSWNTNHYIIFFSASCSLSTMISRKRLKEPSWSPTIYCWRILSNNCLCPELLHKMEWNKERKVTSILFN